MKTLFFALLLFVQGPTTMPALPWQQPVETPRLTELPTQVPVITKTDDKPSQFFVITFAPGADYVCTVYQEQIIKPEQTGVGYVDGKYTPRHCWQMQRHAASYTDDWAWIVGSDSDWLVWAEVQYFVDTNGDGQPQEDEIHTLKSNVVEARR